MAFQHLRLIKITTTILPYNKIHVLAALPNSDHESERDAKHGRAEVWRGSTERGGAGGLGDHIRTMRTIVRIDNVEKNAE